MSEEQEKQNEAAAPQSISDLKKKMKLKGTVKRIELYGAFIDIGLDAPAVLHISQLGQRVNRVSDMLSIGEEVEVWVDKVDPARNQVTVTMTEPLAVEWGDLQEGQVYSGKVVRLENFGAFIDIGAEKEGLAHVSELSHNFVKHPAEVVNSGDEVQVKVLGYNRKKRRINLSIKALTDAPEREIESLSMAELDYEEEEFDEAVPTAMEFAMRKARGEDPMGSRRRGKGKKREKKGRRRAQDDILARTLSLSGDD